MILPTEGKDLEVKTQTIQLPESFSGKNRGNNVVYVRNSSGSLQKDVADEIWNEWHDEIKADGYSIHVYGSEVWFEKAKGRRIQFTATVEASRDDKSFGFFKRPTKGQVL